MPGTNQPYHSPVPIHYGFILCAGMVIVWSSLLVGAGYWMGCR